MKSTTKAQSIFTVKNADILFQAGLFLPEAVSGPFFED